MIVDIILIFLAAMFNSGMDTLDHHFGKSIFNKIKNVDWRLWFNENQGWKNKYVDRDPKKGLIKWSIFGIKFNKPVQISDAWHFFKMLMIFSICMIPSLHIVKEQLCYYEFPFWSDFINVIIIWTILGTIWNLTFNRVFYNWILLSK